MKRKETKPFINTKKGDYIPHIQLSLGSCGTA